MCVCWCVGVWVFPATSLSFAGLLFWSTPNSVQVAQPTRLEIRMSRRFGGSIISSTNSPAGNNITGYSLWNFTTTVSATAVSWFVMPAVLPGDVQFAELRAVNLGGPGPWSPARVVLGPSAAPAIPRALTSNDFPPTMQSDMFLTVESSGLTGLADNGSPISQFRFAFTQQTAVNTTMTVFVNNPLPLAGIQSPLLQPNTPYSVQWSAYNTQGWSPYSPPFSVSTLTSAPFVTSVVASCAGSGASTFAVGCSITLTFNVATNGLSMNVNMLKISADASGNAGVGIVAPTFAWQSGNTQLRITITSIAGGTPPIGAWSFSFQPGLTTLRRSDCSSNCMSALASLRVSPPLTGTWGTATTSTVLVAAPTALRLASGVSTPVSMTSNGVSVNLTGTDPSVIYTVTYSAVVGTLNPATLPNTPGSGLAAALASVRYVPRGGLFFGFDGITITVTAGASVSRIQNSVEITPVNHAPTITAPATLTLPIGGSVALTGFAFADVDILPSYSSMWGAYGPTNFLLSPDQIPITVIFHAGSGSFSYNAAAGPSGVQSFASSSSLRLTGLNADLLTAVPLVMYSNNQLTNAMSSDIVRVTLLDNANSGQPVLAANAAVRVVVSCASAAAPVLTSARLSDSLTSIVLTFDRSVVISTLSTDAWAPTFTTLFKGLVTSSLPCSYLFNATSSASLGAFARCSQTSSNTITAFFRSSFVVGTSLTVPAAAQGVIRSCGTSSLTAAGSVTVSAPSNPPIPTVILTAPATVDLCASLTVASQVAGLGGQGATYAWSGTNNVLSGLGSLTSSPVLTIPSQSMTAGTSYTISLVVTNHFGIVSSSASVTVFKSGFTVPQLSFNGPMAYTITPVQPLQLYATARASTCTTSSQLGLTFSWSVVSSTGTQISLDNTFTNFAQLFLAAGVLKAGSTGSATFLVTVNAAMTVATSLNTSLTATVYVQSSPLVAALSGGATQTVSRNTHIMLDASRSYDPDDLANVNPLSFAWSCAGIDGSACVNVTTSNTMSIPSVATPMFSSMDLLPGSYVFTVVVSKVWGAASGAPRTASPLSTTITIASAAVPSLLLGSVPSAVNPNGQLVFTSQVGDSSGANFVAFDPTVTYAWTVLNRPEIDLAANVANGVTNTPNLIVNNQGANLFAVGQTYAFQLSITTRDGASNTATTAAISVNAAPSNGVVAVSPINGTGLQTSFTLTTSNWEDDQSASTLTYEFSRVVTNTVNGLTTTSLVILAPRGSLSSFTGTLPSGAAPDYLVTINVRSYDSFNAFTDATISLQVFPLTIATGASASSTFTSLLSASTQSATDNGATTSFASTLGSLASALNTGAFGSASPSTGSSGNNITTSNAQLAQMRQQLFTQLQTVSSVVSNVVMQSNIAAVAQVPAQVSLTTAKGMFDIITSQYNASVNGVALDAAAAALSFANLMAAMSATVTNKNGALDATSGAATQSVGAATTGSVARRQVALLALSGATDAAIANVLAAYSSMAGLFGTYSVNQLSAAGGAYPLSSSDAGYAGLIRRDFVSALLSTSTSTPQSAAVGAATVPGVGYKAADGSVLLLPLGLFGSNLTTAGATFDSYYIAASTNPLNLASNNNPFLTPLSSSYTIGLTDSAGNSVASQTAGSAFIDATIVYSNSTCATTPTTGAPAGTAACQPTCYTWNSATSVWSTSGVTTVAVLPSYLAYSSTGSAATTTAVTCKISAGNFQSNGQLTVAVLNNLAYPFTLSQVMPTGQYTFTANAQWLSAYSTTYAFS
jgi:hypothetical protein